MTKLNYLLKQYQNILGWYRQSEEKAKFIVKLNTLIVGVVNGLVFLSADNAKVARLLYTRPVWILLGLSGVALIGSYVFVLIAIWARHKGLKELPVCERLWFFGHVAAMSKETYSDAIALSTSDDYERTLIAQNYILSKNVRTKYDALNWAITFTIAGLMFLFALGIVYGIAVAHMPLPPESVPGVTGL